MLLCKTPLMIAPLSLVSVFLSERGIRLGVTQLGENATLSLSDDVSSALTCRNAVHLCFQYVTLALKHSSLQNEYSISTRIRCSFIFVLCFEVALTGGVLLGDGLWVTN